MCCLTLLAWLRKFARQKIRGMFTPYLTVCGRDSGHGLQVANGDFNGGGAEGGECGAGLDSAEPRQQLRQLGLGANIGRPHKLCQTITSPHTKGKIHWADYKRISALRMNLVSEYRRLYNGSPAGRQGC